MPRRRPQPGRALQIEDLQDEFDAVERVRGALADAGVDDISFAAEIARDGSAVLHLLHPSPAAESGIGNAHPGSLILVEDAVPEPWRRLPEPVPAAVPAPSVALASLERTLRERIPDAVGATVAEIAAAEARLGIVLPDELKVLHRVMSVPLEVRGDEGGRHPPDAAVQGLVGSPGWIVFGDNGGGDRIAVDLTPGPRGHAGQIIMLDHEQDVGGDLLADSLTGLVSNGLGEGRRGPRGDQPPAVARVNIGSLSSVEAAAHPELEVLSIGVWEGEPLSLAPVTGLPRLRTLTAYPGTLADPLEIAELTGLEFLELGPEDWRVLLDAEAVPRSLSAASIEIHGTRHPLPIVALANELLALWDRPPITRTTLEGNLGPVA